MANSNFIGNFPRSDYWHHYCCRKSEDNESIVSEYIQFQGRVVTTLGLGVTISQATASGNESLLGITTVVMFLIVVLINRLVWRPLYRLTQEKYQLLV